MSDLHETPRSLHELVVLRRGTTYKSALLGDTGPWLLGLASIGRNGGLRDDNLKRYSGDTDGKLLVELERCSPRSRTSRNLQTY